MKANKTISIIVGLIVIIAVAGVVFAQKNKNNTTYTPVVTPIATSPSTTNTDSATPAVSPTDVQYTSAQVATHNNQSDCWTSISGSVYNVTPWISKHPGGAQAIISLCGIDGSSAFNGQHGGQARPAAELASFKIGALK